MLLLSPCGSQKVFTRFNAVSSALKNVSLPWWEFSGRNVGLSWSGFQTPLCKFPFSVDLLCCVTLHCTAKWFICMFFSIMVYPRILKVVPCALQQDLCYPLCIFFLPPSLSLLSSSLLSLSLPCYARVFSSYSEQGLPSTCGAQTSLFRGFSCCGALGCIAQCRGSGFNPWSGN